MTLSHGTTQEIEGMMAIVAKGDAFKPDELQKVMDGKSHSLYVYLPQISVIYPPTVLVHLPSLPEGGQWAKAKTCSFLHERCNYSHVTSSNWTQPSFKLMLTV